MSALDQFRPIGELAESEDAVIIERRDPARWRGVLAEAVDRAVDDGDTVYIVEDGRRVAVITPIGG
jgi:hypothetical protein